MQYPFYQKHVFNYTRYKITIQDQTGRAIQWNLSPYTGNIYTVEPFSQTFLTNLSLYRKRLVSILIIFSIENNICTTGILHNVNYFSDP